MFKGVDALQNIDVDQFSSDLEEMKKEIINNLDSEDVQGDEAILLEVIRVIQEDLSKRKGKAKKADVQSDVRFLAYLNLFNTLMNVGLEDEDFDDEDFEYEDEDEDDE